MRLRNIVCCAAALLAYYAVALSENDVAKSGCLNRIDQYVEAHRQWLTDRGLYVDAQPVGLIVDGKSIAIKGLFDLSGDDPKDDRPRLCVALVNPDGSPSGRVNLKNEFLAFANLTDAVLSDAILEGAVLFGATITDAKLRYANLRRTNLNHADVGGTVFAGADFHDAVYTPDPRTPPSSDVANIMGIAQVNIEGGRSEAGMVQLRKIFKDLGLRDEERQATYAIERYRARTDGFGGLLSRIFIGGPTGWGRYPIRAWYIIAALAGLATVCYTVAIVVQRGHQQWCRGGIYYVRLSEFLSQQESGLAIGDSPRVDHLCPRIPWCSFTWALYFALLSCFHIGWRDLNVGLWVARVQTKEFALRAYGWVRVVSGLQSLFSVYLVAIWALTYFGRPFE